MRSLRSIGLPVRSLAIALATLVTLVAIVMMRSGMQTPDRPSTDIPVPFVGSNTPLGSVVSLGKRGNIEIFDVTFDPGQLSVQLLPDRIYLIHIPANTPASPSTSLEQAMRTVSGSPGADFYGYQYMSPDAAQEKANAADPSFTQRFPGRFVASPTAKRNDTTYGSALARFEQSKSIQFEGTQGITIDPQGALFVLIVNDEKGATLSLEKMAACGDGIVESEEECDDGNTVAGDTCTTLCKNARCGDGIVLTGTEECDDGNNIESDQCSNSCKAPLPIPFGFVETDVPLCPELNCAPVEASCSYVDPVMQNGCKTSCGRLVCTQTTSPKPVSVVPSTTDDACATTTPKAGMSWQNPKNPYDVNGDGAITEADSTSIVDLINTFGPQVLPGSPPGTITYYDVDGDGSVAPGDALRITNYLHCKKPSAITTTAASSAATTVMTTPPSSATKPAVMSDTDFVKTLADTNKDDTISDTEALLLTLNIVDATNAAFNTVRQYDINNDGSITDTDVIRLLTALDSFVE